MRPPFRHLDNELLTHLQKGVASLRGLVVFWLRVLLVTCGATGFVMLGTGIALGASLHKAAYVVGGFLALSYLALFVLTLDACETVSLILDLLNVSDEHSREDILRQLHKCQKQRSSASSTVFPEADFDIILQQTLQDFPRRLRFCLVKSLQLGPAMAAAVSLCCMLCIIFLEDIPAEVCSLPVVSTSLLAISVLFGFQVQLRASPLVRTIAMDEFGNPPCKLIELHTLQLRRRVAATPEGRVLSPGLGVGQTPCS